MTIEELQAQVQVLTAQLGLQTDRRQAHIGPHTNLLHPAPSATVAKQNFFYDGMSLPNTRSEFPVLRFRLTETGVEERCCRSQKDVDALGPEWSAIAPSVDLPSPLESLEEAMASLTEDERQLVMEEQRKTRLSAIQQMLSQLSPDDLASLQTGGPVKRGPGRPKKALA